MKTFNIRLIIILGVLSSLMLTSCEDLWDRCIEGNGDRRIEHRTLEPFSRIEVNGDFEVQIDTGYGPDAIVETDENLIDLVVTHVSGDKLIIETRNDRCLEPSRPIEITVGTRELEEITLNGSGLVYCYGLTTERLSVNLAGSGQIECNNVTATSAEIELEGSGFIKCDLIAESVETNLEGSGEIKLLGDCISANYDLVGSGRIKASQCDTENCTIRISGSGVAEARVYNALDVTIIGSGIVYYTGDPSLVTYISGSGRVVER